MTAKTAAKGGFKSRTEITHDRLLFQIHAFDDVFARFSSYPKRSADQLKKAKGWQRYRKHYARVQYRNRVAEWGGR